MRRRNRSYGRRHRRKRRRKASRRIRTANKVFRSRVGTRM